MAASGQSVSVIVYRIRNARAAHQVERLRHVLGAVAADLAQGCVVVIEDTRYRVRRLPIGRN